MFIKNLLHFISYFILSLCFAQKKIFSKELIINKSNNKPTFNVIEPESRRFISDNDFIIPDTIIKYKLSTYCVDYKQYAFQYNFLQSKDSFLMKEASRLNVHLNSAFSKDTIRCFSNVLLFNQRNNGSLVFIFDTNNNNSFIDETQYEYVANFKNDSLDENYITCNNIIVYDTLSKIFGSQEYYVKPIINNSINIDSIQLRFKTKNKIRIGKIDHKKISYQVNIFTLNTNSIYDSSSTFLYIVKAGESQPKSLKPFEYYRLKELIPMPSSDDNFIRIDKIDAFGLNASYVVIKDKEKIYGYKVDNYLKNIKTSDINFKNVDFMSLFSQAKYTVIDFWGTWCGPCLSIKKDFDDLSQKFEPIGVKFISVAYDKDRDSVISSLKENPHRGTNIFNKWNDTNGIVSKLGIESFPSFLVIDKMGKILFRDDGINGFKHLTTFLKSK